MNITEQIAAWARRPRAERLARLAATPDELGGLVRGASAAQLPRRPAPGAWAAVEVVCHLRDLEESFHERLAAIVAFDEPRFPTTDPNRWALERQYLRHDAAHAARAFGVRRAETLGLVQGLPPEAWTRAGWQLDSRGRRTVEDFVSLMAWHDQNHLAQVRRALEGRA
jgi:hypothetical protein